VAERLRQRAEQYLIEAETPEDRTFQRALDDFNDEQMRGS
jgi:hypothetical protein